MFADKGVAKDPVFATTFLILGVALQAKAHDVRGILSSDPSRGAIVATAFPFFGATYIKFGVGARNIGTLQILSIWFVEIPGGASERIASANMCAACVQVFSGALSVCAEEFFVLGLPSHVFGSVVAAATGNWLTTLILICFGA